MQSSSWLKWWAETVLHEEVNAKVDAMGSQHELHLVHHLFDTWNLKCSQQQKGATKEALPHPSSIGVQQMFFLHRERRAEKRRVEKKEKQSVKGSFSSNETSIHHQLIEALLYCEKEIFTTAVLNTSVEGGKNGETTSSFNSAVKRFMMVSHFLGIWALSDPADYKHFFQDELTLRLNEIGLLNPVIENSNGEKGKNRNEIVICCLAKYVDILQLNGLEMASSLQRFLLCIPSATRQLLSSMRFHEIFFSKTPSCSGVDLSQCVFSCLERIWEDGDGFKIPIYQALEIILSVKTESEKKKHTNPSSLGECLHKIVTEFSSRQKLFFLSASMWEGMQKFLLGPSVPLQWINALCSAKDSLKLLVATSGFLYKLSVGHYFLSTYVFPGVGGPTMPLQTLQNQQQQSGKMSKNISVAFSVSNFIDNFFLRILANIEFDAKGNVASLPSTSSYCLNVFSPENNNGKSTTIPVNLSVFLAGLDCVIREIYENQKQKKSPVSTSEDEDTKMRAAAALEIVMQECYHPLIAFILRHQSNRFMTIPVVTTTAATNGSGDEKQKENVGENNDDHNAMKASSSFFVVKDAPSIANILFTTQSDNETLEHQFKELLSKRLLFNRFEASIFASSSSPSLKPDDVSSLLSTVDSIERNFLQTVARIGVSSDFIHSTKKMIMEGGYPMCDEGAQGKGITVFSGAIWPLLTYHRSTIVLLPTTNNSSSSSEIANGNSSGNINYHHHNEIISVKLLEWLPKRLVDLVLQPSQLRLLENRTNSCRPFPLDFHHKKLSWVLGLTQLLVYCHISTAQSCHIIITPIQYSILVQFFSTKNECLQEVVIADLEKRFSGTSYSPRVELNGLIESELLTYSKSAANSSSKLLSLNISAPAAKKTPTTTTPTASIEFFRASDERARCCLPAKTQRALGIVTFVGLEESKRQQEPTNEKELEDALKNWSDNLLTKPIVARAEASLVRQLKSSPTHQMSTTNLLQCIPIPQWLEQREGNDRAKIHAGQQMIFTRAIRSLQDKDYVTSSDDGLNWEYLP